jgi:hypothetical protein
VSGIALAGMHMPGLRALTDGMAGATRARAAAWYTSAFTLGSSLSFLLGQVEWKPVSDKPHSVSGAGSAPADQGGRLKSVRGLHKLHKRAHNASVPWHNQARGDAKMEDWAVVRRRRRSGTWISPIVVVVVILFCAISVAFWRLVFIEDEHTVANQVDYDDAALCSKFGFALGSARHDACKFDLLDLRHRHEYLIRQSSFP